MEATEIKLTQYSKGAGCGCKIAPDALEKILKTSFETSGDAKLLVGNDTRDDAAVYDLGDGNALISTVDFFMPIVDDAFDFGRIAAANAISDVYAMGGKPIFANAILGWPIEKLPAELASKVLDGARTICREAGIVLAGGHSIDSAEPIFGLSVNGLTRIENIKRNKGAKEGDLIYVTKSLGTGILSTAMKRNVLEDAHKKPLVDHLITLNKQGESFGKLPFVTSMTDITGFGLLGHLGEILEAVDLSATLDYKKISLLPGVKEYSSKMIIPDNTYRNWNSYKDKIKNIGAESFFTLCDPQTNGGLLVTVSPDRREEFERILSDSGLLQFAKPVGSIIARKEFLIEVTE